MSIASRVAEAVRHLAEKDYESAMIAVCIALDATARREFPKLATNKDTGKRCTAFVKANLDIITSVGFGGAILAAPGSTLRLKTPGSLQSSAEIKELEKIIYETLRCTLLHEASLPGNVAFTEEVFYGEKNGQFYIPAAMVYALLLAIIGASCNSNCKIIGDWHIQIGEKALPLNVLWGKADRIREHLGIGRPQAMQ
jgi:hypothetical protein